MKISTAALGAMTLVAFVAAGPAVQANIAVEFDEGAPKDTFYITNTGTCAITAGTVVLDLEPSKGKLIFDVTASGAGVEVFQPFDVISGADALMALPMVDDGQSAIMLPISTLAPDAEIVFTIDVDDTIGQREITVTGSEIEGATASYTIGDTVQMGAFSTTAKADIVTSAC